MASVCVSWVTCVPAVGTALDKFVSCKLSWALSYHKMLFNPTLAKDLLFIARSLLFPGSRILRQDLH